MAAVTVAAVMLKPIVTITSYFWSANCWISVAYSEESFGTIEDGVAAPSVVAASTAPL